MGEHSKDGFLPVRVVGSDAAGNEEHIGDFENGVALKGMNIVDIQSQMPIAHMAKMPGLTTGTPIILWQVPSKANKLYYYIFLQVMPSDAPVEVNVPGSGRRWFF